MIVSVNLNQSFLHQPPRGGGWKKTFNFLNTSAAHGGTQMNETTLSSRYYPQYVSGSSSQQLVTER
jgi:hypothetical protein